MTLSNKDTRLFQINQKKVKEHLVMQEIQFKTLMTIGIQPKHKGFFYLAYILTELKKNPDELYDLHRNVYPQLCSRYRTNDASIERNIRFAVTYAWTYGNKALFQKIFNSDWCPSVREFISMLAMVMRYSDEELHNLLS